MLGSFHNAEDAIQETLFRALHRARTTIEEGVPDWAGTHITWDLAPVENGTRVRFAHRDYASTEGSFASVGYSWA